MLVSEGKVAANVLLNDVPSVLGVVSGKADDLSDLRLVPIFNERDPEMFFSMFERLAEARGWPDSTRTSMLQCVLTGRAQEAFSALSNSDGMDYAVVKSTVLKAYELVPEAYRQQFGVGKEATSRIWSLLVICSLNLIVGIPLRGLIHMMLCVI